MFQFIAIRIVIDVPIVPCLACGNFFNLALEFFNKISISLDKLLALRLLLYTSCSSPGISYCSTEPCALWMGLWRVFRDPSLGTRGAHSQWMLRHGFSASSWVQLGESQGWSLSWVDTETSNLSSGLPDFYLKCLSSICISIFLGQEYGTLCPHASACPASLWRVPQEVLTREIFWVLSCLEQFICSIYSLMSIWLDKKYKIVFSLLC